MDLSMKWLADYVDCDMPIKDFVSALTLSGSKVECFEQEGEDISNVVVGKVVSMERHPDSDHMFITQVEQMTCALQLAQNRPRERSEHR